MVRPRLDTIARQGGPAVALERMLGLSETPVTGLIAALRNQPLADVDLGPAHRRRPAYETAIAMLPGRLL
jgi:hypothetical protein